MNERFSGNKPLLHISLCILAALLFFSTRTAASENCFDETSCYNTGKAAYQKKDYETAIVNWGKAADYAPAARRNSHMNSISGAYLALGIGAHTSGNLQEAVKNYGMAIALNPNNFDALMNRSAAYIALGDDELALRDLDSAAVIKPNDPSPYVNRGAVYDHRGGYDRAIAEYNKAIKVSPKYANAFTNRGAAYSNKGNHTQAVSDLDQAIKLNSKDDMAWYNRGNAYRLMCKYELAIKDYGKALDLNPSDADALNNRGNAYYGKGDYDHALTDYLQAIRINPMFGYAYMNLVMAYTAQGNVERARMYLDQALSGFSEQLPPDLTQAMRFIRDAIGRTGAFPDPAQLTANASAAFNSGDFKNAASYLLAAGMLQPRNADIDLNLALCYLNMGADTGAIRHYYRYLYLNPSAKDKKQILDTINSLAQ
jgi:tetratricopeptide (TPR) repeat protein